MKRQLSCSLLLWLCPASLAAHDAVTTKPTPGPLALAAQRPSPASVSAHALPGSQRAPLVEAATARQLASGPAASGPVASLDRVLFDQPGDGRIWARGATYKASFGGEGFVYIPAFSADAPQNYPMHFVMRSVRVGGRDLVFAASATPTRTGGRVTFDRGAVREHYDLTLTGVEQTFEIDAEYGEVDVEIELLTELAEDAAQAGLQFGNAFGHVSYGTAYLVLGESKREVETMLSGRTLRWHVPATQRDAGPVVIDPILSTHALGFGSNNSQNADIAYDEGTDRYLAVWEYGFSATDVDVYAELRNSDGSAVPGSQASVDFTSFVHQLPKVANLNFWNKFLVVTERFDPAAAAGRRWTIWGRTRNAALPITQSVQFQVNDPIHCCDTRDPDVGGDSGTGSSWTVVWTHLTSPSNYDVHSRQVRDNALVRPPTVLIESTAGTSGNARISLSNGNGRGTAAHWLVVYSYRPLSSTDVMGAVLDINGDVVRGGAIDNSTTEELYPHVSTPTDASNGIQSFMVSYQRQGGTMMGQVVNTLLNGAFAPTNLTQAFGFSGNYGRVESDGCRFAVMYVAGNIAYVATLAVASDGFRLHEPPVAFPGRRAAAPNLAAKRSGGSGRTDYGIVFTDITSSPSGIVMAAYRGHAPAGGFARRPTGCGGLGITETGRPFLGEAVSVALSRGGSDAVGLLLGLPAPAAPVCPGCSIGLDLTGPVITVPNANSLSLTIGCVPYLAGRTLALQGYAFGSGSCLGQLRFSDTIDVTLQ